MKRITAAMSVAVIFALSACGSTNYVSAMQVADAIGCAEYGHEEPMSGASESGSCTLNGADLFVSWFASAEGFDSYKKGAAFTAGMPGASTMLIGDKWSVECTEAAACEKAKTAIGGEGQDDE